MLVNLVNLPNHLNICEHAKTNKHLEQFYRRTNTQTCMTTSTWDTTVVGLWIWIKFWKSDKWVFMFELCICIYSAVPLLRSQFSPISSQQTPHSSPMRAKYWGVCSLEFQVWFMSCCCRCSAACKIAINWTLQRHLAVYVSFEWEYQPPAFQQNGRMTWNANNIYIVHVLLVFIFLWNSYNTYGLTLTVWATEFSIFNYTIDHTASNLFGKHRIR